MKTRGQMQQGLDGSRYQLMDVLGGEVEGDPQRMLRMSGDAAKLKKEMKLALRNGGLVKMKRRIGAMIWKVARGDIGEWQPNCSQIRVEEVDWSQQLCFSFANSRVTLTCAQEAIIYSRLASLMQFKLSTNVMEMQLEEQAEFLVV